MNLGLLILVIYKGFESYNVSGNLSLAIELANDAKDNKTNKETVTIACTIENVSDFPEEIILGKYSGYHYDMKSPIGFFVNIIDHNKNIIANEFSVNLLSSNEYRFDELWDQVIFNPGEKITVNIKLIDIMGNV